MSMLVRLTKSWAEDEGAGFRVRGGNVVRQMAGDKLSGTKDGWQAEGPPSLSQDSGRYGGVKRIENSGGQSFLTN